MKNIGTFKSKDYTTICISCGHGISKDQTWIKCMSWDDRWWIRLYHFLIRKNEPTITTYYSILSIDSKTTITIREI